MKKRLFILLVLLTVSSVLSACNSPKLYGVLYTTDRGKGVSIDVNMSQYTSRIPKAWIAVSKAYARYEVRFSAVSGHTKECGPYGMEGLTLSYKVAGIRLTVRDLETDSEVLSSPLFSGQRARSCPDEHEFKTYTVNGAEMPVNDTEWITPDRAEIEEWILANLEALPGMVRE